MYRKNGEGKEKRKSDWLGEKIDQLQINHLIDRVIKKSQSGGLEKFIGKPHIPVSA